MQHKTAVAEVVELDRPWHLGWYTGHQEQSTGHRDSPCQPTNKNSPSDYQRQLSVSQSLHACQTVLPVSPSQQ